MENEKIFDHYDYRFEYDEESENINITCSYLRHFGDGLCMKLGTDFPIEIPKKSDFNFYFPAFRFCKKS